MKKILIALLAALLISSTAHAVGFAFGVFIGQIPFDAPIQLTDTGVQLQYMILCYESSTRQKAVDVIEINIPDGSTQLQSLTAQTDAMVNACATHGITVARTRVFVPAFTQGQ